MTRSVAVLRRSSMVLVLVLGLSVALAIPAAAWNVTNGRTSISAVHINGKGSDVTVAPGSTINVTLEYKTSRVGCRNCIWQIEVGFANQAPDQCIFDSEINGVRFARGTATFSLIAPSTPGSYFLAYDTAADFSCFDNGQDWWEAPLDPQQHYFGHVTVK